MDNCCREYLFLVDFFMVTGSSATDLFHAIMSKTLSLFMVSQSYEQNCDRVALNFYVSVTFTSVMSKICDCVALNFYDPVIFTRLCHYLLQVK